MNISSKDSHIKEEKAAFLIVGPHGQQGYSLSIEGYLKACVGNQGTPGLCTRVVQTEHFSFLLLSKQNIMWYLQLP